MKEINNISDLIDNRLKITAPNFNKNSIYPTDIFSLYLQTLSKLYKKYRIYPFDGVISLEDQRWKCTIRKRLHNSQEEAEEISVGYGVSKKEARIDAIFKTEDIERIAYLFGTKEFCDTIKVLLE